MYLQREPRAPRADVRYLFGSYLADERNDAWRSYLVPRSRAALRPSRWLAGGPPGRCTTGRR